MNTIVTVVVTLCRSHPQHVSLFSLFIPKLSFISTEFWPFDESGLSACHLMVQDNSFEREIVPDTANVTDEISRNWGVKCNISI